MLVRPMNKWAEGQTDASYLGTCGWMTKQKVGRTDRRTDLPRNLLLLQLSSSHSGLTMCLATDTAVRNLTVRVTFLATRWVTF